MNHLRTGALVLFWIGFLSGCSMLIKDVHFGTSAGSRSDQRAIIRVAEQSELREDGKKFWNPTTLKFFTSLVAIRDLSDGRVETLDFFGAHNLRAHVKEGRYLARVKCSLSGGMFAPRYFQVAIDAVPGKEHLVECRGVKWDTLHVETFVK